jgi:hypothetical protein
MGAKESQRIIHSASVVERDIPEHVFTNFLSKIYVDMEKVG